MIRRKALYPAALNAVLYLIISVLIDLATGESELTSSYVLKRFLTASIFGVALFLFFNYQECSASKKDS